MAIFTRRIMGIETEYGITCMDRSNRKLGADEIARYMFRPVIDTWGSSNIFHPNASRLYLDVGSHPEVATAECDSLTQLVAYDRAGDEIVDELARTAEESLAKEGIDGQVYLFKNNLDSIGNSYGCHENYLVGREVVLKKLGKQLLPFLITRQLIAGAGCIKDGNYHLSQRADHVWEGVSSATTRSRPIINTRDEPHADSHLYRRLHVIVGDSNPSQTTTALKVGSTLLVLEMIEAGVELPNIQLANEVAAIREISGDLSGQVLVPLAEHDPMPAIAIQRAYLEAAKTWLHKRPESDPHLGTGTTNEEMGRVVQLWDKVVQAVENQDFASIAGDIDWAIKLNLLRRYQSRLGLESDDFNHPKLAQVDLAYHDIRAGRGLFRVLEARGLVSTWVTYDQVEEAKTQAPSTTRAALRGAFLREANKLNAATAVDWLRLKVNRPEPQIVELGDPFASHDRRVDDLVAYMRAHAAGTAL